MQRSRVDLPQPEAPSKKNNSPGAISKVTPFSARVAPKILTTCSARIVSISCASTLDGIAAFDKD
jgi:hypothetical protein